MSRQDKQRLLEDFFREVPMDKDLSRAMLYEALDRKIVAFTILQTKTVFREVSLTGTSQASWPIG